MVMMMSSVIQKPRKGQRVLKDGSVPESTIQAGILRWLATTGLIHWRQMAGTIKRGRIRITLGPNGIPDILLLLPPSGRLVGLEVKSAKGRQRKDQKEFQALMEASGGLYFIVRSLTDARSIIDGLLDNGPKALR
jgi:hypothetical protein